MPKYDKDSVLSETDVVVFVLPYKERKRAEDVSLEDLRQGREIQKWLETHRRATIKEISVGTRYPVKRIAGHVLHMAGLKKPKLEIIRSIK